MAEVEVRVKGLAELQKYLNQLPAKMERNILRGALRDAAKVIEAEAKALVPVSLPNQRNQVRYGGYRGALRDSIRVSTRVKRGTVTATIRAGGVTKRGADTYYARWVEFGTAAHWIRAKNIDGKNIARRLNRQARKRGSLSIAGRYVGSALFHPGSKPRPFMRPAMDRKAQSALMAAGEYIKRRLSTKHGIDTPDALIDAL